jgi:hypothetical protein
MSAYAEDFKVLAYGIISLVAFGISFRIEYSTEKAWNNVYVSSAFRKLTSLHETYLGTTPEL